MIKEEEVFKIGKLAKTHGLKGEITFRFDNDIFDRVDCPYFVLKIDNLFVPFFILEYRFKGSDTALVIFEDSESKEKASKMQGLEVYFPKKYCDEASVEENAEFSWDYFIGFEAIDKNEGNMGIITRVDTQTMNTLFLIEHRNGKQHIVPAVEEFILEIDETSKTINLHLPEGLIE